MIKSFRCADTALLFQRKVVTRFSRFENVARRKLEQLYQAGNVNDLRIPPGNRLESLSGDRKGQFSIRVNDRYRLCFRWPDDGPEDVEMSITTDEMKQCPS